MEKGHQQEFKAAWLGFLQDLTCKPCLALLERCRSGCGKKMLGRYAAPGTDEPPGDMCPRPIADVPAPAAEGRSIVAAGAATSGSDTVGEVLVELSIHGCS